MLTRSLQMVTVMLCGFSQTNVLFTFVVSNIAVEPVIADSPLSIIAAGCFDMQVIAFACPLHKISNETR